MLPVITAICSSIASGMGFFFLLSCYFWFRYYVRQRNNLKEWKCQPDRWPTQAILRRDLLLGSFNLCWASTLSGLFTHYVVGGGRTAVYFSPTERGLPWLFCSTIIYFCIIEIVLYTAHRILHRPLLFRFIHRWHHRTVAPTTLNSPSMHPLEYLIYQVLSAAPLFFLPIYGGSVMFVLLLNFSAGMLQHSGVNIYLRIPGVPASRFHDDHHRYFHCNYGLTFTIIDQICGTLRRKRRRYGIDVFGGQGTPSEPGDTRDEFVDYHCATSQPEAATSDA